MAGVHELEADVAATRERLNETIDRIQDKLTVSGIVDEFMGQVGVPRMESGHDLVLGLLRRHPVPVMIVAAGIGFLLYRYGKRGPARLPRVPEDELGPGPLVTAPARIYDPDLPTQPPPAEIADTRRMEA